MSSCDDIRVPNLRECLYITPSTVCNLKCRFCAYPKTSIPKAIMPIGLFADVIDKACAFGFATFGLTPLLGEALLDPRFLDKLELLERREDVTGYSFCTNLTTGGAELASHVARLQKLEWLSVSVYGHDPESFARITGAPPRVFLDVLSNLRRLADRPDAASHLEVRIRTSASFSPEHCHPELRDLLSGLNARNVRVRIPHDRYSNWSGLVSAADLVGLDIHLKPESPKGTVPCAFPFYKHTVLPDGRVNACYADDGNATMVIGDLTRQRFDEIYSLDNTAWMELIRGQQEGRWSPTCLACTGYRSVRERHYSYDFHRLPALTMRELLDQLE